MEHSKVVASFCVVPPSPPSFWWWPPPHLPRPTPFPPGRTRRRHRQWRVRRAGFAGSNAPRDVFPVADDWPLLLGNTAGMDPWHMQGCVCWFRSSRCVPFCLGHALMLRIMDGISQKDCYSVGWFYWLRCTSRCVSFPVIMPLMLVGIVAGVDQKEGYVVPRRKLRKIRSCSSSTRSLTFLSYRRGRSPWSRLLRRLQRFPSCV